MVKWHTSCVSALLLLATASATSCTYKFGGYTLAEDSGGASGNGGTAGVGGSGGTGGTGGSSGGATDCDPLNPSESDGDDFVVCTSSQQCVGLASGAFRCQDREGNAGDNEPCESAVECRAGFGCVAGICREFCDVDDDECGSDQRCTDLDVTSNGRDLGACITLCDPRDADECPAGVQCVFDSSGEPSCQGSSGSGQDYDACEDDSDCAQGYSCVRIGSTDDEEPRVVLQCLRWAVEDEECSAPDTVRYTSTDNVYDGETYGVCFSDCDPSSIDASGYRECSGGERCSVLQDAEGTWFISSCQDAGTLEGDRYCEAESSCQDGLACNDFGDDKLCVDYCSLVNPSSACPADRSCTPFDDDRSLGSETYGWCSPNSSCDPLTSLTCMDSQRCTLKANDYSVCEDQADTLSDGDACPSIDSCTRNTTCVGSANWGYVCAASCRIDQVPSDCAGGAECLSFATPSSLGGVEYGYCPASDCNPFEPYSSDGGFHACQPEVSCNFISGSATRCKEPGTVSLRGTCEFSYDCADGLACVFFSDDAGNTEGTCLGSCRPGGAGTSDCVEPGTTCYSYAGGGPVINDVEFGYCGDP